MGGLSRFRPNCPMRRSPVRRPLNGLFERRCPRRRWAIAPVSRCLRVAGGGCGGDSVGEAPAAGTTPPRGKAGCERWAWEPRLRRETVDQVRLAVIGCGRVPSGWARVHLKHGGRPARRHGRRAATFRGARESAGVRGHRPREGAGLPASRPRRTPAGAETTWRRSSTWTAWAQERSDAGADEEIAAGRKTNVTLYTRPEGKRLADLMAEVNERYRIGLIQTS